MALMSVHRKDWSRGRVREGLHIEPCLYNPCALLPAPQNIRLAGDVIRIPDSLGFCEKAMAWGHDLEGSRETDQTY